MAEINTTNYPALSSVGGDELLFVIDDPSGTPADRTVTPDVLLDNVPKLDEANTFTSAQTFSNSVTVSSTANSYRRLTMSNTNNGTDAFTDIYFSTGSGQGIALQKFGSGYTGATWNGASLADWARFRTDGSVSGLIITTGGSASPMPIILGTNDADRLYISGDGKIGINESSPSAQMHVVSASIYTVGAIFDTAPSPTVDIAQFKNNGTSQIDISTAGIIDFRGTMGNSSKNPATDAPVDWVQVEIGGTTRYLPAYAAS